nr:general negative regulator of transcription subunit 1 [Quercus suber]
MSVPPDPFFSGSSNHQTAGSVAGGSSSSLHNHPPPTTIRQTSYRRGLTTPVSTTSVSRPASRQSSVSSNTSLASPSGPSYFTHSNQRTRAITNSNSPRLTPLVQASGNNVGPGGSSRLARHSPSLSSSTLGSPISSSGGSSSQLTSLVYTQLNILLSTLRESNFITQAEKIRRLVDDSGMEIFATYFRRLLQGNASTVFPGLARVPPTSADSAGSYQMLVQEVQKISSDPVQAVQIAEALNTSDGELFRDFDLESFIDHFRLDPILRVALASACRVVSKQDIVTKAGQEDSLSIVLASIIERLSKDQPRTLGEQHYENLKYAVRVRYRTLNTRMPPALESVLFLTDLLDSQDSRLAKHVQRVGPRGTTTLEACSEMLASIETRDISYLQIANALLFMVLSVERDAYNPTVFVSGVRQHRAGAQLDWTDVVQGFDRDQLRITKKQFLALYDALRPLAIEYANFDIQILWGGRWQNEETQLSFAVAFLSTTPDELDVTQVPRLRQAFSLADYEDAPDSIRSFAAEAVKHPLVSRDATEALFTIIFRSPEAYNFAQVLGIPDTLINPNMTMFVCAASAVAKPWAPLQDQALKQLFYPFVLKQHHNYDFVMHSLWMHDKTWVAGRLVEFYQTDSLLLSVIYEHAVEHHWLELLLTIQSSFVVDLAAYAHGKEDVDLREWAQPNIASMGAMNFARAIVDFLRAKMDDEANAQRNGTRTTTMLELRTVHGFLVGLAQELLTDDDLGPIYRQCLQTYPRLFNYGEDAQCDSLLDAASGEMYKHALSQSAGHEMEVHYKAMYSGETSPDQVVSQLKQLKESHDPDDQELFAAMLSGLFEEYSCFGEYPNEALATTAVLFGGLIRFNVISQVAESAAIYMIFQAVSVVEADDPSQDSMYRFGLQAMIHMLARLKEWPLLAERILSIPTLRGTQAIEAAETVLKELDHEQGGLNGTVNGLTNGALDDEYPVDAPIPPFSSVNVDPPLRPDVYEDPDDDVTEKITFVLNNVSKRNLEEKFKDLDGALEDRHHQWFAHYLVEELAKSQPNFQSLYLQILQAFNQQILWAEVLRETYVSCARMLNAQSTLDSSMERTNLKNLAGWLGSLTLARNQPILHRNLSFKELLIEGHDTSRLVVAIPFTCKALIHAASSKVFKPPNPWLMELLGILSELYHCFDLRLNLKFEIEVLCKDLSLDIAEIEPLDIIRTRPLLEQSNMLQQYLPDGGPDGFSDMHIMGLSKRAPSERFSPTAVIEALPDLGNVLQVPPPANGSVTQDQLRTIFVNAAQQAIYEIIAPVVERSVTIAAISTSELIQKDFATEPDVEKVQNSSHQVVRALSGSLALVTCKEPLRMSIMNNIRILASRTLPEQLPEGQILMFVNDNIDTVCSLVERAAEEHSMAEIDAQLAQSIAERKAHNEQRPNESFNNPPVTRWAQLIPDPYKQDPNHGNASGLNRQQLSLYEEFGRQARITPATHAATTSVDASRQISDVLSDTYLPSLPTPAETPALLRQTPQQHRIQVMQQSQRPHINGYVDTPNIGQRTLELMQDLQLAAREAPEEHVTEIGENTAVRRIFEQLVALIQSTAQKDGLAVAAGHQCLMLIYGEVQKQLEVEVFVKLLSSMCQISLPAGRNMTLFLSNSADDKFFNATAAIALIGDNLMAIEHVDMEAAKALKARRPAVLSFLKDMFEEILFGETPFATRAEFVFTAEALAQWLAEDSELGAARELLDRLRETNTIENGMPSSPSDDKRDQMEYIFEQWVVLQRRETSERTYAAFVRQLDELRIIADPNDAAQFYRTAIDMSYISFERLSGPPYPAQDAAYIDIDAFAKLVMTLTLHQSSVENAKSSRAKTLEGVLRLVVLTLNDHQNKQGIRFNGRMYFRFFSALICELHALRGHWSNHEEREIYGVLAVVLEILQPRLFPSFAYSWLALIGHRLLVQAFLSSNGRSNGGWTVYTKLVNLLFFNLADLLTTADSPPVTQDFYRGVLRFTLMLHHDFPDYVVENHVQLNSSVPPACGQLNNIINSTVPRAAMNEQPDPFTPGLKTNRLEQVRQAPAVATDLDDLLREGGIKEAITQVLGATSLGNEEYTTISDALESLADRTKSITINALIVHIGMHATTQSSVFSSAAAPAKLIERLLSENDGATRCQIIGAMMNQVRYVNAHTHYFSTAIQHIFTTAGEDLQQQMMRILVGRLMVPRPHPWGIIVMVLELIKNPAYDIWAFPWMETASQVKNMLVSLVHSQERMPRSPLGAM